MTALKKLKRQSVTKVVVMAVIASAVLVSVGILVWRGSASTDPKAIFAQALQHNLTETDLTCTIQETTTTSTTKQAISLDLVSRTKLRSILDTNPTPSISIQLEEIDTPAGNFVRYKAIKATDKNAAGKTLDFSKALNVWGKTATDTQHSTLFGRTALGNCIVPLAHLDRTQAAALVTEIQMGTIYKTDYAASRQQQLDGKTMRVYDVAVQPRPYLDFMKKVAKDYGLKDLDGVDTTTFSQKTPENMKFYIDARSHRLQKIDFTAKKHSIAFSDYGSVSEITAPKSFVSAQELQKRLQTN